MSQLVKQEPIRCQNPKCGAVLNVIERGERLSKEDQEKTYSLCGYCGAVYRPAQAEDRSWHKIMGTPTEPTWIYIVDESTLPAKVRQAQESIRNGRLQSPPGVSRKRPS